MAVAKTPGAYWERTGAPNGADQTWLGWFRPDAFAPNGDYRVALAQDAGANNWMGIYLDAAAGVTTANFWSNNLTVPIIAGPVLDLGEWICMAVRRTATTSWTLLWRWEGDAAMQSASGVGTGTVGTVLKIGAEHNGGGSLQGGFGFWRVFQSALTDQQILDESAAMAALLTEWADWPIADISNDADDISGNSRPLTFTVAGGGQTNTTGPSIALPAGPSEGTAGFDLDLSLAATGSAQHAGTAALDVDLALAAEGHSQHAGTAGLGVNLDLAAHGHAPHQGAAAFTLDVGFGAAGERQSAGAADLALDLGLAATGDAPTDDPSQGTAGLALGLELAAAGAARHQGTVDFPLSLTLAARSALPVDLWPIEVTYQERAAVTVQEAGAVTYQEAP